MKRIITRYGIIAGLLISAWMLGSIAVCYAKENFEGSMLLGYASMILAFSFIFVGVKNYRDKENEGFISFGKAFKLGLYISLVASTMYVIAWLIDYYLFVPDFMDKYAEHTINQAQKNGATQQEIADQVKEMNTYKELYNNPLMVILMTYAEVLPVGIVISLVSALILKRKSTVPLQAA